MPGSAPSCNALAQLQPHGRMRLPASDANPAACTPRRDAPLSAARAEGAAEALLDRRSPAASMGHLLHMPSHTYVRVGRYHDATIANIRCAVRRRNMLNTLRQWPGCTSVRAKSTGSQSQNFVVLSSHAMLSFCTSCLQLLAGFEP
jgi:hypothetical protein